MSQSSGWNQPPTGGVPPGQAAYGAAPGAPYGGAPQPGYAGAPPKKSKKGLLVGGCLGCLGMLLSLCVCGGYIGYLEEGGSYMAPGEEVTSVPVTSGAPLSLQATWEGTGYADFRVYVDLGASAGPASVVTGNFGCDQYGSLRMEDVNERYVDYDAVPDGWVRLPPEYGLYTRSPATIRCQGVLTLPPGTSSARLVLTRRQRPSDWMSEWF